MIQNSGVEQWPAWEQWTLDALAAKVHRLTLLKSSDFKSIASEGDFRELERNALLTWNINMRAYYYFPFLGFSMVIRSSGCPTLKVKRNPASA